MTINAPEKIYAILRLPKKSMLIFWNNPLVILVVKSRDFPFFPYPSINTRVIKIAVNKEVAIPINKVVAKPLIGPVPNNNNIKPVSPVVIFASRMEDKAFLKPSEIASACAFPLANSSRIRSKISTFASTDIPIVSTIPAIPGNVSTAPSPANTPKMNRILTTNAISAKIPALP